MRQHLLRENVDKAIAAIKAGNCVAALTAIGRNLSYNICVQNLRQSVASERSLHGFGASALSAIRLCDTDVVQREVNRKIAYLVRLRAGVDVYEERVQVITLADSLLTLRTATQFFGLKVEIDLEYVISLARAAIGSEENLRKVENAIGKNDPLYVPIHEYSA